MGNDIILREYQQEAVDTLNKITAGRHLCTLATGLGKTVIMSRLSRQGKTLLLSHRDELVYQPAKYFDCSYGIEKADTHSNGEDVVSASVQTLYRKHRLEKFPPEYFDTIIIDEAHHASSNNVTYMNILNYFKPRRVFGFTATGRGDGVRLDDVFEDIVFSRDTKWGIKNHYLCPVKAIRIVTNADLSSVRKFGNDFNEKDLNEKLEHSNYVSKSATAYMQYCYNKRQTLLYAPNIKMCQMTMEVIRSLMPEEEADSIQMVTGKTDKEERRSILEAYKTGAVKAIVNCMVLTEGFDAPETSGIIVMRPTCNASLYQQIVGRGLRIADKSKENCLILDIVPDKISPMHNICTAISLFGENAEKAPEKSKQRMLEEYDPMELAEEISAAMNIIGAARDINSIKLMKEEFSIFAEDQIERVLQKDAFDIPELLEGIHVHMNASSKERYRIRVLNRQSSVTLSEPDMMGNTDITINANGMIYRSTMKIEEAVPIVRKLCDVTPSSLAYLWDKAVYESWDSESATENQKGKIETLKKTDSTGILSQVNPDTLTKAQASELIDISLSVQATVSDMKARKIFFDDAKTARTQKKREETALAAYNQYVEENHKIDAESRENFAQYILNLNIAHTKAMQAKARHDQQTRGSWQHPEWWKLTAKKAVHVEEKSSYLMRPNYRPSEKQAGLIRKLENELAISKISIDGSYSITNSAEASKAIAVLLVIKKYVPSIKTRERLGLTRNIYIEMDSFIKILHSSSMTQTAGDIIFYPGDNKWSPKQATFV